MRSQTPMKTAKIGYIAVSALLCALGILLICRPSLSANLIGTVCGILMLIFGVVKFVGYFSKDLYRLAFQYDLVSGILLMVFGIIILLRPSSLMNYVTIVLGLYILADGVFKIQIAVDSKKFGLSRWWAILVPALICVVFGAMLIFFPAGTRAVTVIMGIDLLAEGLLNICTVICAVKIVKNQKPDYFEAEYTEKGED